MDKMYKEIKKVRKRTYKKRGYNEDLFEDLVL